MIRRCDGSDPNLISRSGSGYCPCGLTFDDVERMVIWPHNPVGPKLTLAELLAVAAEHGVDVPGSPGAAGPAPGGGLPSHPL